MKQTSVLRQFEYTIPSHAPEISNLALTHDGEFTEQMPLLKMLIDFAAGNLKLEGDWQFLVSADKERQLHTIGKERVRIETAIYPALAIDLSDPNVDGIILMLEGNINDGTSLFPCSGMMALDNIRGKNGLIADNWKISLYLYDGRFNECEIKLKVIEYPAAINFADN